MTIQLIGVPLSNYYNVVKLALLEKGIAFEEVLQKPSKEDAYLEKSPMGKIPCLKTDQGYLSETLAILTYLEQLKPEPSLLPADPFAAGRAMQTYQLIDHYADPCGRGLLGMAFFGQPVEQEKATAALEKLTFAAAALKRVVRFEPFIAGDTLSIADLNAAVTLSYVGRVIHKLTKSNPLTEIEGMLAYFEMLAQRPHFQKVYADRDASFQMLIAK